MKKTLFFLFIFSSITILAANSGKIIGKVIDKSTGEDLIGANIVIEGKKLGASTGIDGTYSIPNIPQGKYSVRVSFIGYGKVVIEDVVVVSDSTTILDIELKTSSIEYDELVVTATKPLVMKDMTASYMVVSPSMSAERFAYHNTEEYDLIVENTFLDVIKNPLSTFGADVDAASYSNVRRYIMRDQLPLKDVVRTEEFINYFSYDYPQPKNDQPLSINIEYSDCPWNKKNKLIHIGLKGKELSKEEVVESNFVFLIDVSGSMNSPEKLPLLKKSFQLLLNELNPNDKVAIVVYASSTGLVLPSTPGSEKEKIIDAINNLEAGGSTAGGAGIQLAYKVASENFIKGGNNRIILATDGDFNVGISSTSELVRFIEVEREKGIFLTALGFGMGNYKDSRLQQIADKGNGNHAYIDNILEAKKVLVNDIRSTLFTIAKDVKIQVEFNPTKIESYRLIGYENRKLKDEDFEDDKKDAGEIGAGHTVTALYEVVLADPENSSNNYELKYQETKIKETANNSNEVITVRIRYKEPDGDKSKEFSKTLTGNPSKLEESSNNFRFSASVAQFAMILRDSEFKGDADIETLLELGKSAKGEDWFGYRAEYFSLVERVALLLNK